MPGVVTVLDSPHCGLVEGIWAELAREFGVRAIHASPHPHVSYHVAESYTPDAVRPILEHAARRAGALQVKTTGLGIFSGASPVLFIPVVRDPVLTSFQEPLWHAVSTACVGAVDYYHPQRWVPHITLASGDIAVDMLQHMVGFLAGRDFDWDLTLTNLCLVDEAGEGAVPSLRCAFGGLPR